MSLLAQSLLISIVFTAAAWIIGIMLDRPSVAASVRANLWACALWGAAALVPLAGLASLLPLHSVIANGAQAATALDETGHWMAIDAIALTTALAGAVFTVGSALGRLVRLKRLVAASPPLDHRDLRACVVDQARRLGIAPPELRVSPEIGPLVVSHPRAIVLPGGLVSDLDTERLGLICGHELAHLKRGDDRAIAVETVIIALFWFNPFLHAVWRRLNAAREEICDQIALTQADSRARKAFAETLIDALKRGSLQTPAAALGGLHLNAARGRLKAVLSPVAPSRAAGRVGVVVAAVMILASAGVSVAVASNVPRSDPSADRLGGHQPGQVVPEMTPTGDMAPAVDPTAPNRSANGLTPLMKPTGNLRAAFGPPTPPAR